MNSVYIEANVFIYLSDKKSPFYPTASILIKSLKENKIYILTSTETIQEIIHFSQNIKQVLIGLKTAKKIFEIADEILAVDQETVTIYLDLVKKHKNIKSRDSLHVAVCIKNKIDGLISYDSDFKKFRQIKSLTPEEFLRK